MEPNKSVVAEFVRAARRGKNAETADRLETVLLASLGKLRHGIDENWFASDRSRAEIEETLKWLPSLDQSMILSAFDEMATDALKPNREGTLSLLACENN